MYLRGPVRQSVSTCLAMICKKAEVEKVAYSLSRNALIRDICSSWYDLSSSNAMLLAIEGGYWTIVHRYRYSLRECRCLVNICRDVVI